MSGVGPGIRSWADGIVRDKVRATARVALWSYGIVRDKVRYIQSGIVVLWYS